MAAEDMLTSGDRQDILLLKHSAREFCQREMAPQRLRGLRDANQSYDQNVWQTITDLGWTASGLPESAGGIGVGAAGVAAICQELGRVVAGEPFIESAIFSAHLLASAGAPSNLVDGIVGGSRIVTSRMTPSLWRSVSDVTAEPSGDRVLLNGAIDHISLASAADSMLIPATVNDRVYCCIVDTNVEGIVVEPRLLADGTFDGHVRFDNAPATIIFRCGDDSGVIDQALALSGIGAGAYLLGLCEALLETTLDYVRTREQFGQAIGRFQALQHRLVDMYMHIRLTAAANRAAIEAFDSGEHALESPIAARRRACNTAMLIAREAIQMHGAIGYTEDCDVALYVQRALVMTARYADRNIDLAAAVVSSDVDERGGDSVPARPDVDVNMAAPDDDWNKVDDTMFRHVVRGWIAGNYPAELRHYPTQIRWADIREWHQRLLARGWAAPTWPREHGGMGLAPSKTLIFIEELERHGVTRAPDQGIVMIGPVLIEYGNDEQRQRYLQPALTGEHIWCQGYSEPNAGSDLASLKTSARLDGDEFVVNGQKTWTSHALDATHMYCLVRTDVEAKPQRGISFLLIDLQQSGVDVRPIRNLGGHVDFCEVFLDDVRVPIANLVGELNQGWTIAKALLGHERLFVGSPKLCQHALNQLRELAGATGLIDDPVFREELLTMTLDVRDLEALYSEFAEVIKNDDPLGADVAILKIWATETYTRLSELLLRAAGPAAAVNGKQSFADKNIDVLMHYYNARPAPIYAGSNEIQRNIIAKHVLQLPT